MKILYLSLAKQNSSIDGVYIKGLRANNVEVIDYSFHGTSGYKRYLEVLKIFLRHKKEIQYLMVGYDSPYVVVFLYAFCRQKIIYNALCSVYERLVISRNLAGKFSLKSFYYWLIDFLACHFSCLVMLETSYQVEYFKRMFILSNKKLFCAFTGVDDEKFQYRNSEKYPKFTVLFRGKLLPEAGGDLVIRAAKILENTDIHFLMLANGMELPKVERLIEELKPKNLKLIVEFLPDAELSSVMQKSHISLGQLSAHERLHRTIPHKAFESIAMKIPYITARNPAVMELLREGETCLAFEPGNAEDLAKKILWAYKHQDQIRVIGENAYKFYQNNLTAKNLAKKLLMRLWL